MLQKGIKARTLPSTVDDTSSDVDANSTAVEGTDQFTMAPSILANATCQSERKKQKDSDMNINMTMWIHQHSGSLKQFYVFRRQYKRSSATLQT
jgi:hypothetical protein